MPRLNSLPHIIAVYASQWSSPSTTQHSLPGGCYALPEPDLHRLDHASFCLAHRHDTYFLLRSVGTGVTSYPTVFTLADKFSIKPQFVFGTQEAPRIGGCPILCVLGKGWDTRRSVSRFVVSHPSQKSAKDPGFPTARPQPWQRVRLSLRKAA
jgi:hypothetical protein